MEKKKIIFYKEISKAFFDEFLEERKNSRNNHPRADNKKVRKMSNKLTEKIKNWNIKRKSEYILCPYCLNDLHDVVKWYKKDTIISKPLYKCCKCGKLFTWKGKKINELELNNILS